jgi:[DsrC]-trisulfide reductase subunit O
MSEMNPSQRQSEDGFDAYRRRFLGMAVAAGASLPASLMLIDLAHGKPDDQAVTDKVRWGMLVDTTKCADGCDDCVTACHTENGIHSLGRPETDAQWIRTVELVNRETGKSHTLPMLCQHCEHPPCVDVCPTGASFRRADGIVLVDRHICIGCRYCMMACPYKARSFVHEEHTDQNPDVPRGKGCVESCTFCVHRVDRGDTPACVEACSAEGGGAMLFGDLNDPESDIAKRLATETSKEVRADLGLNTGVRYQGI